MAQGVKALSQARSLELPFYLSRKVNSYSPHSLCNHESKQNLCLKESTLFFSTVALGMFCATTVQIQLIPNRQQVSDMSANLYTIQPLCSSEHKKNSPLGQKDNSEVESTCCFQEWFPVPMSSSSQIPMTPAPGDLPPLFWPLQVQTCTLTNIQIKGFFAVVGFSRQVFSV